MCVCGLFHAVRIANGLVDGSVGDEIFHRHVSFSNYSNALAVVVVVVVIIVVDVEEEEEAARVAGESAEIK